MTAADREAAGGALASQNRGNLGLARLWLAWLLLLVAAGCTRAARWLLPPS